MTTAVWMMLLALAIIWGGAFMFNGLALRSFGTLTVVALRLTIGAVVLNAILLATGRKYPQSFSGLVELLLMGLLNNAIPFVLIVWGQTRIDSGTASIINAATPLFTILLAHAFTTDEKLSVGRGAGVLIGFVGVAILFGVSGFTGERAAQVAVAGAALSYAFAAIFGKRFGRRGMDPLVIAAGQLTASSLLLIPPALLMERPWTIPTPGFSSVMAVLGLGLLCSAVAYILYFRILEASGAGNVLLVTMIIPFFATLFGALVLGESLSSRNLIAFLVLALGLTVVDGRIFRRRGLDSPSPVPMQQEDNDG